MDSPRQHHKSYSSTTDSSQQQHFYDQKRHYLHQQQQQQHQQHQQQQRSRTNSSLSIQSNDGRGAIRKRLSPRSRSISQTTAERLHGLALDQASSGAGFVSTPPVSAGFWLTPRHSPQPNFYPAPAVDSFPQWTIPSPPRSDSSVPSLNVDSSGEETSSSSTCPTTSEGFQFETPTTSAEMSSLGFLLPSQYGNEVYQSEPNNYTMDQNYPPMRMPAQRPTATEASSYGQTISSSPALYQSRSMSQSVPRRHTGFTQQNQTDPTAYEHAYRRISNPYDHPQGYPIPQTQSIPPLSGLAQQQSPQPSPSLNSSGSGSMSSYTTMPSRSPSMYDTNSMYAQHLASSPPTTQMYPPTHPGMGYHQHQHQQPQPQQHQQPPPPPFVGSSVSEVLARPMQNPGDASAIRVLNQRPKPQCWDHGCNGRQFSTFSNLLRHQREKSGTATKSYCPKCGAEFTRTTARNGHLAHDKCSKQRQSSEEK